MRIALGIHYDGTAFSGWQSQPHSNTVQQTLEAALHEFSGVALPTTVAGRTDTGVHGIGQVVHFDTNLDRGMVSWRHGINAFLPKTVAVQWAKAMPDDFHARFAAFERTYCYVLYANPVRSPLLYGRAGWLHTSLDLNAMRTASQALVGEHDFSAFRSSECQAKTPVKHLSVIDIEQQGDFFLFIFRASAFLHHMVRNIMGCLVSIGRGRQPVSWMKHVLASGNRRQAAPTFMPDGLYLARVGYPESFQVPEPNWAAWPFPMPLAVS